jgi:hypothetical protein
MHATHNHGILQLLDVADQDEQAWHPQATHAEKQHGLHVTSKQASKQQPSNQAREQSKQQPSKQAATKQQHKQCKQLTIIASSSFLMLLTSSGLPSTVEPKLRPPL